MTNTTTTKKWDELDFIMDWEDGQCSDEQVIEGFQHLIDNGHAWQLQGAYGRMATELIENGYCKKK